MRSPFFITVAVLLSSFTAGMPAIQVGAPTSFFVSMGDSLSVGFQPGLGETRDGYVDVLWRSTRETIPGLAKQKLGCAGETSGSLISGSDSPCTYAAGSQLDAAVAFLGDHGGQVPFITINIGSNDVVERCFDFDTAEFDRACVEVLLPELEDRVTQIVDALRGAAGADVPIHGMTYYNPFLGLWVVPTVTRWRGRPSGHGRCSTPG